MDEQKWIELISILEQANQILGAIKSKPQWADPRGIAIASTHLETAMLWIANARISE